MSTLTPTRQAETTGNADLWMVAGDGCLRPFLTPNRAAVHLVDRTLQRSEHGITEPLAVTCMGEGLLVLADYTGYVADVLKATGWDTMTLAGRFTPEGQLKRLDAIELVTAILVGEESV